jgi:ligand-binding sensor domain-containing protein/signal transduction histidine kinase
MPKHWMKLPNAKRRILFWLAISVASLAFPLVLCAERLPVRIYTSADGLGSGFVDFIMRDSRGFMWFCTRDGLSRFDGAQFVTYQVGDKNAPPGIESIFETSKGDYWITTTGGVYRFKPNDVVPRPPTDAGQHVRPRLNAKFITSQSGSFYEDAQQGALWFLSDGIYLVEEKDGRIAFNKVEMPLPKKYPSDILKLQKGRDGSLWLLMAYGVLRRLPDERLVYYDTQVPLANTDVSLQEDNDGRIWMTRPDGLYIFKPEPLQLLEHLPQFTIRKLVVGLQNQKTLNGSAPLPEKDGEVYKYQQPSPDPATVLKFLHKTNDGHIWLSTTQGLIEFDGAASHSYAAAQGIPPEPARMAEDLSGNLWIGGQSGVLRLDRRGLTTYESAAAKGQERVRSIYENKQGEIFAFVGQGLVSLFDGQDFRTVRLRIQADDKFLWTSNGGFLDSLGQWWVLTNKRLYRFARTANPNELASQSPAAVYDRRNGLPADTMYCMFEDSHGGIWVSTRDDIAKQSGLARWMPATDQFYALSSAEGFPQNKAAASFAEDRAGNLWFGFYQGGLVRYADNHFTEFTTEDGLPDGFITQLYLDHAGRLWISSSRAGLSRVDDPTAGQIRFINFTAEDGLSSNNVRSITEDLFGRIYIGTARGVDALTPDAKLFKHYSVNDGLAADLVGTALRDSRGALWFGTPNGISRLLPYKAEAQSPPPILLGGLRIAGVEQQIPELGIMQLPWRELASNQNNLQIDFFGLDFDASEPLRYQFMLEGADLDWNAPTEQRTVNYANLQPGTYRFLVHAVTADGTLSRAPATLSFKILRPVWQRWWFIACAMLFLAAAAYALYRYRIRRLLELERVRTRIATDLHDDIGAGLSRMAILSEVVKRQKSANGANGGNGANGNNGADDDLAAGMLTEIADSARGLVDSMSDIVWSIDPRRDDLQSVVFRVRQFAADVLEPLGIEWTLHVAPEVERLKLGPDQRRHLYLIFKEGINNISRHAANCKTVELTIKVSGHQLVSMMRDDGCGFSRTSTGKVQTNTRGGNGLPNMQTRAAELSGQLDIQATQGGGTCLTLTMPVK